MNRGNRSHDSFYGDPSTDVSVDKKRVASQRQLRIRGLWANYEEAETKLLQLVGEARDEQDWEHLGYKSWTAYLADTVGEEKVKLAAGRRQELVGMLSSEGMSTRAIATTLGVSVGTVHADRQVFNSEHLKVETSGSEPIAEDSEPAMDSLLPKATTGLDGKSYTRADRAVPKQRRRPITDSARTAIIELTKAVQRVERIVKDDRFAANRDDLVRIMLSSCNRAAEDIFDVLEALGDETPYREINEIFNEAQNLTAEQIVTIAKYIRESSPDGAAPALEAM